MILVDANLLVYAAMAEQPQHEAARSWLDERLNGRARVGLPWSSLLAFARIVSNPRLFRSPMTLRQALKQVEDWLALPPAWVPQPTQHHGRILAALLSDKVRSDLVPDAHLAALAIEHQLLLCSTDGDFDLFLNLRWENPLT